MAIAEYTSRQIAFRTTEEQERYLDEEVKNISNFIREAIAEKIERESKTEKDNEG